MNLTKRNKTLYPKQYTKRRAHHYIISHPNNPKKEILEKRNHKQLKCDVKVFHLPYILLSGQSNELFC